MVRSHEHEVVCCFCSGDEMSFATDFAVESDVEFDFIACEM
jgi:hypothetical protein